MKFGKIYNTLIGKISIIQEGEYIVKIEFGEILKNVEIKETTLISKTINEIKEYLNGNRKKFDIPIKLNGTGFQKKVWNELLKIPYGETCSYKDIAIRINNEKGVRAVGMANHNNPIAIIVPCHRVIGKNGKLVGYAGGIDIKSKLLEIEKLFT